MSTFDRLNIYAGERLFDEDSLNRELLMAMLKEWLGQTIFVMSGISEMRLLVRDLRGLPEEGLLESFGRMPRGLRQLSTVPFFSLAPVNRRECVRRSLSYAGITNDTAVDLLGTEGWAQVQAWIDRLCAGEQEAELGISDLAPMPVSGQEPELTAQTWTQAALECSLTGLLDGRYFDITDFRSVTSALEPARKAAGLPEHETRKTSVYVGLEALHCIHFDAMREDVRQGLPRAILDALALDDSSAPTLFSGQGWERVRRLFSDWARASHTAGKTTTEPTPAPDNATDPWRPHPVVLALAVSIAILIFGAVTIFGVLRHRTWQAAQVPTLSSAVGIAEPAAAGNEPLALPPGVARELKRHDPSRNQPARRRETADSRGPQ